MRAAHRWTGAHEIRPYRSGRLFFYLAIFPPAVHQLAVCLLRTMFCGWLRPVDVYRQELSFQHGLSDGQPELCDGYVCRHHFLSRTNTPSAMDRRIPDTDRLRAHCTINNVQPNLTSSVAPQVELQKNVVTSTPVVSNIQSEPNNPNLTTLENDVEALMECEGYAIRQGANFSVDEHGYLIATEGGSIAG